MTLMATETFRFQSFLQPFDAGAHHLQIGQQAARIFEHGLARIRELRLAGAGTLKKRHLELCLEVRDRVADHRLRAVERARGGGEAAGFRHGKEHLQLIQCRVGKHLPSNLSIISIYIIPVFSIAGQSYFSFEGGSNLPSELAAPQFERKFNYVVHPAPDIQPAR